MLTETDRTLSVVVCAKYYDLNRSHIPAALQPMAYYK